MSTTKRSPVNPSTPQDWSNRLAAAPISKHDLNSLVADYLFTEGYLDAASHFAREAALDPSKAATDLDSIRSRRDIRSAVQRGKIEEALDKVVELDPEILDHNPSLHFSLLQQHLIELIRHNKIPEALEFAQNELAPRGEEHPKFLEELEKTMALLAFELPNFAPVAPSTTDPNPPRLEVKETKSKSKKEKSTSSTTEALPPMPISLSTLLDPSHRLSTALSLNAAILSSQGHAAEPKLPKLFGVLNWGEGLLGEKTTGSEELVAGGQWKKWDLREVLSSEEEKKDEEMKV